MAKYAICSVYDAAVKAFMQPFFARSKDEARRSFGDACRDPKLDFGKHPMDFSLHYIGEWDDVGLIVAKPQSDLLMEARDCVPDGDYTPFPNAKLVS